MDGERTMSVWVRRIVNILSQDWDGYWAYDVSEIELYFSMVKILAQRPTRISRFSCWDWDWGCYVILCQHMEHTISRMRGVVGVVFQCEREGWWAYYIKSEKGSERAVFVSERDGERTMSRVGKRVNALFLWVRVSTLCHYMSILYCCEQEKESILCEWEG